MITSFTVHSDKFSVPNVSNVSSKYIQKFYTQGLKLYFSSFINRGISLNFASEESGRYQFSISIFSQYTQTPGKCMKRNGISVGSISCQRCMPVGIIKLEDSSKKPPIIFTWYTQGLEAVPGICILSIDIFSVKWGGMSILLTVHS